MTSHSPALAAIVGADPGLRNVLARARLVGPTRTPVLVTGESGTGKELLARALHELGPDPGGPFVTVNCGALPREPPGRTPDAQSPSLPAPAPRHP